MNQFIFTKFAEKQFKKLDPKIQKILLSKLQKLKEEKNLFHHLRKLQNITPITHRLRIGDYRLFLEEEKRNRWIVLKIGHRREVYR